MHLSKTQQLFLGIGTQFLILLAMIGFKVLVLASGTDVLLSIAPVDPRDPLRGDYVTFQYDISRIPGYNFASYGRELTKEVKAGDTVYVSLYQSGMTWNVQSVTLTPPEDEVFLKGIVRSVEYQQEANAVSAPSSGMVRKDSGRTREIEELRVSYGIEEYFIPENSGRGVQFAEDSAVARVKVDESGNAVLRQIFVDGKPWP